MKFKTSSGIKSIVGKDLITNRYIAIFELVKNSYDAKATEIVVSLNSSDNFELNSSDFKEDNIIIADNGIGMSKSDLENKWLFLAYSDKKEGSKNKDSENEDTQRKIKNRAFVGSKGIGRFSSDCLGSVIKIKTKIISENIEHQLTVNWDSFDEKLETKFETIEVDYKESNKLSRNDCKSYTIIEISKLREGWDKGQVEAAIEKLRRLKNPFIQQNDLNIYFGRDIFIPNGKTHFSSEHLVTSNIAEVLREKSITITANVHTRAKGHIEITLQDRGELIYTVEKTDMYFFSGIQSLSISLNYLTTSAKSTFTRRMGIEAVNYGNLFIYKNGFHVSPYGETNHDIFDLNMRKTQGYARYIATREIIGYISIEDSGNHFKETSSRNNGFITNAHFKVLENFYMNCVHRPLERYVQLIKWGEIKNTEKELFLKDVSLNDNEKDNFKKYITRNNFELVTFNEELAFDRNKPEKIIKRIEEATTTSGVDMASLSEDAKRLKSQLAELKNENEKGRKENQENQNTIKHLERQTKNLSEKRSESSYSEQITHHLTKLSGRLKSPLKNLRELRADLSLTEAQENKFNQSLRVIMRTQAELSALQDILTKTNLNTKARETINWVELFEWYQNQKNFHNLKLSVSTDGESVRNAWKIKNTSTVDVVITLENLIQNAVEHGASLFDIVFYENYFTVYSDSMPIDGGNADKIFELGFSTKLNGTGIGLNQVRTFMKKHNMKIKLNSVEKGVQFKVIKEK